MSHHGAWIFDDWTDVQVDVSGMRTAFLDASCALRDLEELEDTLGAVSLALGRYVRGSWVGDARRSSGILAQVAAARATIAESIATRLASRPERDLRAFQQALDRQWELKSRLQTARDRIDSIEQGLRAVESQRSRRGIELLAAVGIPLNVAALVAERIADLATDVRKRELAMRALRACSQLKSPPDVARVGIARASEFFHCSDPQAYRELVRQAAEPVTGFGYWVARLTRPETTKLAVLGASFVLSFLLVQLAFMILRFRRSMRAAGAR